MSKKKKANRQSDSHIPNGGHVPTNGWNYGLDGFDFDMDYGDGVEDGAALPEAYGMASLPDGFTGTAEEEGSDEIEGNYKTVTRTAPLQEHMANPFGVFTQMASEEPAKNAAALPDLDWLDPTLQQDPDRLPKNPAADADRGIVELEKAWGQRTDGISLVPNKDKEIVDYQNSVRDPGQTSLVPGADKEVDWRKAAIQRAMRRSAYGENLTDILEELDDRAAAKSITEEHGLVGNVFIHASAFPGMINGKWDKVIKRRCAKAAYILASKNSKMGSLDNYLGKKVVHRIPWKRALRTYSPRLKAAGIKLGSGDARTVLKQAFLSKGTKTKSSRTASLPVQKHAPMMELGAAKTALANSKTKRQVISSAKVDLTQRVANHVNSLVEKGRISAEFGRDLLLSKKSNKEIMEAVTAEIGKASSGTYTGSGVGVKAHRSTKKLNTAKESNEIKALRLIEAEKKIQNLVQRGLISQEQATEILGSGDKYTASEMLHQAAQLATSSKSSSYSGPKFTRASSTKKTQKRSAEDLRILEASKKSGIKASEFRGIIRWARQQMSEGLAGNDLTMILKARFSGRLIAAAKDMLTEIRGTHEGLSGHVYTDTQAYASPTGTQGCEKGAAVHRANALKFALEMPRCGTCKFASTLPDGTKSCQKYNKVLVSEAPVEDPKEYQRLALAQSEYTDQEHTASLFANYDDSFGLQNNNLSDFSYDETPDREELSGFAFGGLLIGGDDE